MTSIILSIGDELVLGQTVDTNSAWLSQQLAAVGCDILGHATVPDDQNEIEKAILSAAARCDALIISGGIGPTADDLTRQALGAVLGVELEMNEGWLAKLHEFWSKRNAVMPEINKIQAMIPRGATMIDNTAGTAAGVYVPAAAKLPCDIFVMPGVPKEMKIMFTRDVLPHIKARSGGAVILSRTLHTFGLGESAVAEKLGPLMMRDRNPSVGTTVANGIVSLRVNARFPSLAEAQEQMESTTTACEATMGDLIFARDEKSLPQVVAHLLQLGDKKLTLATAEAATGGLLAKMLTDLPGSSQFFSQGWVTYSNLALYDRLGVPTDVINIHSPASEPVVEVMARSARRLAKSTYALAITGIPGLDGGNATIPVGTFCIAIARPNPADRAGSLIDKRTFQFVGDREMMRDRAAKMALTLLRFELMGKAMPF